MKKMHLLLISSALCFISFCQGLTTEEALQGDFIDIDLRPVGLLYPQKNEVVKGQLSFSWSERLGAKGYTVELVAANSQTTVLRKTVTLPSLIVSDTITGGSYKWFIRTKYPSKEVKSEEQTFEFLGNTLFVDQASASADEIGHRDAPYKTISDALNEAGQFTATNGQKVRINVAQGTYNETFILPSKVELYGGYNASDWSRDFINNVTNINAPTATPPVVVNFAQGVILDGFVLNTFTPTNAFEVTSAIIISSSDPVIRNNSINASYDGIKVSGNSDAHIVNNNIIVGNDDAFSISETIGVRILQVTSTNLRFESNALRGKDIGIYITDSQVMVNNNLLAKQKTALSTVKIGANSIVNLQNNTLIGALEISSENVNVSHNIIHDCATCVVANNAPTMLINNLIFDADNFLYNTINDVGADNNLHGELDGVAACGNSSCSYGNITTTLANTAVFTFGPFVPPLQDLYIILPNSPPDLDNSGGFNAGDIGANAAILGYR